MTKATRPLATARVPVVRCWRDAGWAAAGVLALVLASLPVDSEQVSDAETGVFRVVNDHTVLPFVLVWTVMQLGNVVVIPIAALVAAWTRRFLLAAELLFGGVAVYLLAKVVKGIVERGRPAELLSDVQIRGDIPLGRGYVSGHAAVATLLAVVLWPWLGRRGRTAVLAVACVVCLARVYVGAHLPLDIIGGAALGFAIGMLVRVMLGRPGPCSPPAAPDQSARK